MNDQPTGLACICNDQGVIQRVLLDGIGIQSLTCGESLEKSIHPGSRAKWLSFLVELRTKGTAVNWEINFVGSDHLETIQVSGAGQNDLLMIMGSLNFRDSLAICSKFREKDEEQADQLYAAIQNHIRAIEDESLEQSSIYDQISRLNNELVNLQRELIKKNHALERLNRTVQELAVTDVLTGQNNRRGFIEKSEQQLLQAKRYNHPLSLILFDVDLFKSINDTFGHAVGDLVLTELAARCQKALRSVDILGRYGGDEFVILLPETGSAGARIAAERIRLSVSQPMMAEGRSLTITISIGIAELDLKSGDLETLLLHADRALYAAKDAGRNCIFVDNGEGR